MKLTPILLMGLASSALSFGATTAYQVTSGYWSSDIWSNAAGGSVVSGLIPSTGDTASLTSSLTLTVSGGSTLGLATLTVANTANNLTFVLNAGTTLAATTGIRLQANSSNYTIAGTLTSAGVVLLNGTNSNITISGIVSASASSLTLGNTGSNTLLTGTAMAAVQTQVGGTMTVATGGKMYNNYSLQLVNGAGDSLTVNGGDVYVNRFYGARLSSLNALVSYNVLSGTFTHTGSEAELVGKSTTDAGVTLFNQSGGTVSMSVGGGSFYLTCQTVGATQGIGIYNLSGGTLTLKGGIYYGGIGEYRADATAVRTGSASAYSGYVGGKLTFTGGNLVTEILGINLVNEGGHLVVGLTTASARTLTSGTASGMTYTQQASGAMDLNILGATSFDKMNYVNNNVVLENGTSFYITLAEGYTPDEGTTFTSMVVADAITGDASTFNIYVNGVLSAWTAEIVGGTTLNLTASYVPEPASAAALVGLLALALAVRRRR